MTLEHSVQSLRGSILGHLAAALVTALVILGMPTQGIAQTTVDDFEAREYTDGTNTIPYRLFVPVDYDPKQSYPLVLFLHGAGERGTDNRRQLTGQTAPLVFVQPENQAKYPCFMLAPQCPPGGGWAGGTNPSTWMRLTLEALFAELFWEFNIDYTRMYITGLSMGGYGTWDMCTRYPGLFAAAVPICGGGNVSLADRCVGMAIWAFHSDDDTVVPVQRSREMIAAIFKAGGEPFYTEYTGYGHASWNPAYREPDLIPWMFAQTASGW